MCHSTVFFKVGFLNRDSSILRHPLSTFVEVPHVQSENVAFRVGQSCYQDKETH